MQIIEQSHVEQAAVVHLTSQIEAAELKRFGWRLPRSAVILNGVDEAPPCSGEIAIDVERIAAEPPLVLFLGRLSWKKGSMASAHVCVYQDRQARLVP